MGEAMRPEGDGFAEFGAAATASKFSKIRTSLATSLFRNSIWLLLRSFLSYGLGAVFWLIVARSYDPDDVGRGAAVLSILLLLARGAALGLPTGMLRFLPEARDKIGLINGAFTVSGLTALAVGIAFLAGVSVWASPLDFVRSNPLMGVVFVASLVFFTMDGVIDNAFVAARRADYGMARSTIFFTLRMPLALLFAGLGVFGIVSAWTSSLLVSVIGMSLLLPRFYKEYRPRLTVHAIRETGILGFSAWTYLTGIVQGAAIFLLPLLILSRPGPWPSDQAPEFSAYFFAAYSIASLLYLVPQAFTTSLLVEGSHPGARYSRDARHTLWISTPLILAGIGGAVLLGRPILALFGANYSGAGYGSMVLMAAASPVVLLTAIYSTDLRIEKRVIPIFIIACLSTAVTLGFAYALIASLGILGVAAGFAIGQLVSVPLFLADRVLRRRSSDRSS